MGFWDGKDSKKINEARGTRGGAYFKPGNYVARVERCKSITTRGKDEAFIAECVILESDNPECPVGYRPSLYIEENPEWPDLALGNVSDFLRAGFASLAEMNGEEHPGVENIELSKEMGEAVTGEENLLAGVYLHAYCYNKPTKKGKDFTRFDWTVPENLAEIVATHASE